MKTRLLFLSLAMAFLLTGLVGCLNDDDPQLLQAPGQDQFDKSVPVARPVDPPSSHDWVNAPAGPLAITTADLSTQTAAQVVQTLVGTGPNAPSISNVTYNGAQGALGTFSGAGGIVGFDSGIVVSSGGISTIVGPNLFDNITIDNNLPGDPDLQALIPGYNTHDAAVLEFDFECEFLQVISFQYVFMSEEYNEYVNTAFNDVFGFFLNGVNIALLTDNTTPVSVNNVNCNNPYNPPTGDFCELYINNDLNDGGGAIDTEMDGFTVVLTATATVNPGINHFKIAIADAGDEILDSNVLIKAQSFVCAPPVFPVQFDMKPTSCPNAFNPKNEGVTPAAILGSENFDVADIDPSTLMLEGSIAPIRWSYDDVSTPVVDGMLCECTTMGADGYTDLTLKFDSQEIAEYLGMVVHGDVVELHITGQLLDGTPIEGMDCIVVKGKNLNED